MTQSTEMTSWALAVAVIAMLAIPCESDVIGYDPFDTATTGDPNNGIYQVSLAVANAAQNYTTGGQIVGFSTGNVWTPSGYFIASTTDISTSSRDGSGGSLKRLAGDTTSNTYVYRNLDAALTGQDVAYASALVRMDLDNPTFAAYGHAGFAGNVGSGSSGARVGFQWDGSAHDLIVFYYDGSAYQTRVVQENVATDDTGAFFVVWKMDQAGDTLDLWVNPAQSASAPAATVTYSDFGAGVSTIQSASLGARYVGYADGGTGFYADEITLGDSWEDVTTIPEPATLGLVGLGLSFGCIMRSRRRRA
jgi:hypothetical protein